MRSFISSFKRPSGFIQQTLLWFLGITVLYSVSIWVFQPEIWTGQHQGQTNTLKAEKFLYASLPEVVVVGSSLSYRLEPDLLPNNWFNLSFGGGSPLTGLEILKRQKTLPKTILIEINALDRDLDNTFVSKVSHPFLMPLKRVIFSLRTEYQPVTLLMNCLKSQLFEKSALGKLYETPNLTVVKTNVAALKPGYDQPLKDEIFAQRFEQLQSYLNYFHAHGVRTVLIQMPIDPDLQNTKGYTMLRTKLQRHFPQERFWTAPDDQAYETRDGVHLTRQSAKVYINHLMQLLTASK